MNIKLLSTLTMAAALAVGSSIPVQAAPWWTGSNVTNPTLNGGVSNFGNNQFGMGSAMGYHRHHHHHNMMSNGMNGSSGWGNNAGWNNGMTNAGCNGGMGNVGMTNGFNPGYNTAYNGYGGGYPGYNTGYPGVGGGYPAYNTGYQGYGGGYPGYNTGNNSGWLSRLTNGGVLGNTGNGLIGNGLTGNGLTNRLTGRENFLQNLLSSGKLSSSQQSSIQNKLARLQGVQTGIANGTFTPNSGGSRRRHLGF